MIELVVGLPGQGKSLFAARTVVGLLRRNKKIYDKKNIMRAIATEMPLNIDALTKHLGFDVAPFIHRWTDMEELVRMRGVDVILDEVANKFDARNFASLPDSVKIWLRHHEKQGVDVYANTQHLEAVDIAFRRMLSALYTISKVFGSPRPGPGKETIGHVWGLCVYMRHNPKQYSFDDDKGSPMWLIPRFLFIRRRYVDAYDTLFEIPTESRSQVRHRTLTCAHCEYTKVVHT